MGLALLRHVEDHGREHNGGDDDEARDVPGERRYGRREEQNQNQRIAEPFDKGGQQALRFGRLDPVRSNCLKDGGGVRRAKAGAGGMQKLQEVGERKNGQVQRSRRRVLGCALRRTRA